MGPFCPPVVPTAPEAASPTPAFSAPRTNLIKSLGGTSTCCAGCPPQRSEGRSQLWEPEVGRRGDSCSSEFHRPFCSFGSSAPASVPVKLPP